MNHGSSGNANNERRSHVVCPTCQRRLTVQRGTSADDFQCPKCLTTVSPTPETRVQVDPDNEGTVRLHDELRQARDALKDVAQIAAKISELEQQVYDLGLEVVKATCRSRELELELESSTGTGKIFKAPRSGISSNWGLSVDS